MRALWLSAALAALLLPSLSLKIMVKQRFAVADEARLMADMAAALSARGWVARQGATPAFAFLEAERGPCRMLAANLMPSGAMQNRFMIRAAGFGPVRYVYEGRAVASPPRLGPALLDYAQRHLHPLGIAFARPPVLALASGAGCAIAPDAFAHIRLETRIVRKAEPAGPR